MKIFITLHLHSTEVLDDSRWLPDDGCRREIPMCQPVFEALEAEYAVTGKLSDVFCSMLGTPLDNKNFSDPKPRGVRGNRLGAARRPTNIHARVASGEGETPQPPVNYRDASNWSVTRQRA